MQLIRHTISLSLSLMVFLIGCAGEENNPNNTADGVEEKIPNPALAEIPGLPLDEVHNALWQDSARPYFMRPRQTFSLQMGNYEFSIPSEMNRADILEKFGRKEPVTEPNVVHVLYNDNLYRQAWMPSEGNLLIDAPTLGVGQKNKPLSRFEPNNTIYLLIGFEGPIPAGEVEAPFAPFYAMRILVDENPMRFIKPGAPQPLKTAPISSTSP
jgi:hypothetical protein